MGARGALAVFDVTRKASMDRLADCIENFRSKVGEIPMVMVGNKTYLRGSSEVLGTTKEEATGFASRYASDYVEISAKDDNGVEMHLADSCIRLDLRKRKPIVSRTALGCGIV